MEIDPAASDDWREWRRLRALQLHQAGWQQCQIAAALAVSAGAVSQWLKTARQGAAAALRAQPRPGAPARLSAAQRQQLPGLLAHGAEAYGWRGEVGTCARVASVIAEEFGIIYSKSQVSRLLRALDWSPQQPLRRAIQRDAAAITHWRAQVTSTGNTRSRCSYDKNAENLRFVVLKSRGGRLRRAPAPAPVPR